MFDQLERIRIKYGLHHRLIGRTKHVLYGPFKNIIF